MLQRVFQSKGRSCFITNGNISLIYAYWTFNRRNVVIGLETWKNKKQQGKNSPRNVISPRDDKDINLNRYCNSFEYVRLQN